MKPKRKRCDICADLFMPANSFQLVCFNPPCAIEWAKDHSRVTLQRKRLNQAQNALDRKALRDFNENDKSWCMKRAEREFNKFIRLRDKELPCVSCGNLNPLKAFGAGQWDAGHYRTKGACPELKFEELNVHKQCKKCNLHQAANIIEYRVELIKRIGLAAVQWVEGPHDPKRYRVADLQGIAKKYRGMNRELEA